ncbi:MAG: FtsX-like permease family protein [Bacteroidia bacterium]
MRNNNLRPPRWMESFLRWGLDADITEDILGDLHELFLTHIETKNIYLARWKYFLSMLSLLRMFRPKWLSLPSTLITSAMIRHYFTIAFRNLKKHLSYSIINILGLGTGLAACILLLLFVRHETSYDRFHKNHERIFRASMEVRDGDNFRHVSVSPTAVLPVFKREFPEVESGVRILSSGSFSPDVVRYEDKVFQEMGLFYADSTFFDIFSFSLIAGDPTKALTRPSSVIVSLTMARKYFGSENPVGKYLTMNNQRQYEVTGVMEDMPPQSHFHADFLASFSTLGASKEEMWWSANYQTYLLLRSPEAAVSLREKIPPLMEREMGDELSESRSVNYRLTALADIHLYSDAESELEPGSDVRYVYIFSGIALIILLIACINYMNLATARAVDRAREVGLRKVIGAYKSQIFFQFIGESVLITFAAVALAVVFASAALPWFNTLTHRSLTLDWVASPFLIPLLLGIGLMVSFLSGIWPAMVFTRFEPVQILRGKYRNSSGGSLLRKMLVVFQFAVSISLIVCTMVSYRQLHLIQNIRLGYDKDQLVVVPMDSEIGSKWASIKGQLKNHPEILEVSAVSESPVKIEGTYNIFLPSGEANSKLVQAIAADIDIVQTLGLQIIAGNNYTPASAEKEDFPFLLNQKAIRIFGWTPEEAVGKKINLSGREGFVQAVVNDFHIASLHEEISPLVIFLSPRDYYEALIRVRPGNHSPAIKSIAAVWKENVPHRPFEYHFLDETYQRMYQTEQQTGKAFGIFAVLAIVIACLGLFGLASFTTLQKSKEIGIRKVLGATVPQIVAMLSGNFAIPVCIAAMIALPLSWYMMEEWLSGFVFRVNVGLPTLAFAAGAALLLAMGTVGYQSVKAALTNPAETLKDE